MGFFNFDLRKALLVLFILAALPIVSLNMQRSPGEEPWYKKPFYFVVGGFQNGYSSFTSGVRGTTSMYVNLLGIKRTNLNLQKENEEFKTKLGEFTELKLENQRLNQLLKFKDSTSMELMAAKVIARDISPDRYLIRINRGVSDGVKKLQAVITIEGVVGYVFRPGLYSSQVLVLTDRAAAIDGIVQRTRARGVISGKGGSLANRDSLCRFRYIERADDVTVGDMIVTGGLQGIIPHQGIFPKGFPIGRITSIKKAGTGISLEAEVSPVVNPANLEEVFLVTNSKNEDFSEVFDDSEFGPPLVEKENPPKPNTILNTKPQENSL